MQNSLTTKRKGEEKGVLERAMFKQEECMSKSENSGAENFNVRLTVKSKASNDTFLACLSSITEAIITRSGKHLRATWSWSSY